MFAGSGDLREAAVVHAGAMMRHRFAAVEIADAQNLSVTTAPICDLCTGLNCAALSSFAQQLASAGLPASDSGLVPSTVPLGPAIESLMRTFSPPFASAAQRLAALAQR